MRLFASFFCLALAASTHAQEARPAPDAKPSEPVSTISLNANLVNLPVIVRDKKGALIQTLAKTDFALSVDGHAQAIRYFDHDANLPLTLGLLVDTSRSQRNVIDEERNASTAFLDDMLGAPADSPAVQKQDRAFIVQFAHEVELLTDLTNSKPKLQSGLKQIGSENPNSSTSTDEDSSGNGGRSAHHAGGTTLYDAVFLSGDEVMHKQQGRKALIILSDGVDRNSKESMNAAIEAAQRADTIIYAIYFKGDEGHDAGNSRGGGGGFPGGGGRGGISFPGSGGGGGRNGGGNRGGGGRQEASVDGKKILEKMAYETGGRLFEVKGKNPLPDIYRQIAEELRTQYRLGYTPSKDITDDGYHRVDLQVTTQKNLFVQTRDGYYTGK